MQDFLGGGGKWLHIDMAAPAVAAERSTGYGVALLYSLLAEFNDS
jgi:probable aminopeptidase NPEPL1